MTGIQTTSLFAFDKVKRTLSERQRVVLDELARHENATNSELAAALHWGINRVTPRTLELRQKGKVVEACRRPCRVTGERCIAWRILQT